MSKLTQLSTLKTPPQLCFPSQYTSGFPQCLPNCCGVTSLVPNCRLHFRKNYGVCLPVKALTSYGEEESVQVDPVSVELQPISSEAQFDRVITEAQQLEESVIIVWMASWCRKCIYLKPKLEKLAVDYHPRIRFYCVDVNNVPHKLVVHAGVVKMPTIQLWKDSKKQAEVIGGYKAHLVVNEVRGMIENEGDV